ncbi:MAG: helix-turn-helix domain-containing protein [Chitinophagales bacterium]|nr:helix-turn-helix domain-containing protein [Chitinophagales bacterium]
MSKLNDLIANYKAKYKRDSEIVELRNQGLTYQAIGDRYGLTRQAVFIICQRFKPDESVKEKKKFRLFGRG